MKLPNSIIYLISVLGVILKFKNYSKHSKLKNKVPEEIY